MAVIVLTVSVQKEDRNSGEGVLIRTNSKVDFFGMVTISEVSNLFNSLDGSGVPGDVSDIFV